MIFSRRKLSLWKEHHKIGYYKIFSFLQYKIYGWQKYVDIWYIFPMMIQATTARILTKLLNRNNKTRVRRNQAVMFINKYITKKYFEIIGKEILKGNAIKINKKYKIVSQVIAPEKIEKETGINILENKKKRFEVFYQTIVGRFQENGSVIEKMYIFFNPKSHKDQIDELRKHK